MKKRTLAIVLLLTMVAPFILYNNLERIKALIPPTEPYKKSAANFEEAFNEQMAQYGMSIDIDSVPCSESENTLYKIVPVQCEDGSTITCIYYPTGKSRKSLIKAIEFEQSINGSSSQTIYLTPILEFLLQEFEAPLAEDKDENPGWWNALTYNQAIQSCEEFLSGKDSELEFYIASDHVEISYIRLSRRAGEDSSVRILFDLWS